MSVTDEPLYGNVNFNGLDNPVFERSSTGSAENVKSGDGIDYSDNEDDDKNRADDDDRPPSNLRSNMAVTEEPLYGNVDRLDNPVFEHSPTGSAENVKTGDGIYYSDNEDDDKNRADDDGRPPSILRPNMSVTEEPLYGNVNGLDNPTGSAEHVKSGDGIYYSDNEGDEDEDDRPPSILRPKTTDSGKVVYVTRETIDPGKGNLYSVAGGLKPQSELYEPIEEHVEKDDADDDEYQEIPEDTKGPGQVRFTKGTKESPLSLDAVYTVIDGETDSESEAHHVQRRHHTSASSRRHRLSQRISSRASQLWDDRNKTVCGKCTRCLMCIGVIVAFFAVLGMGVALLFIFALSNEPCESNPCQSGGNCTEVGDQYECTCPLGFSGRQCESNLLECVPNPCENQGQCHDFVNDYVCVCPIGYKGSQCQTQASRCLDGPCQHEATCVDKEVNGLYFCYCAPGYTGNNCELDIDECASSPCDHLSTCVDGVDGYSCTCTAGYTGVLCESDIDECESTPCQNGGSCTDKVDSYVCTCAAGYTGNHCESDFDECASGPCQNGATCRDHVNRFSCTCVTGYTGSACETDIDDCVPNPCQHSGMCTDKVNAYTCTCQPGYTGTECATNINECVSQPCQHGGTCVDDVNMYDCKCVSSTGYYGNNCEKYYCETGKCENGGTCSLSTTTGFSCACHPDFSGATCNINKKIDVTNVKPSTNVKKAFCSYRGWNMQSDYLKNAYYLESTNTIGIALEKELLAEGFSKPGSAISVSPSEIYLHALSAGMSPLKTVYYTLNGGLGLRRIANSNVHNGSETVSRNVLLESSGSYYMSYQGRIFDKDSDKTTAWCAISLQGTMTRMIGFSAYRLQALTTASAIDFTAELLDSGGLFKTNEFTVPWYGVYYFTFSMGVTGGKQFIAELRVNGIRQVGLVRRATNTNTGDTVSRTTLLRLTAGDVVTLHLAAGSIATTSGTYKDTAFSGFLYEPKVTTSQAWSAYRSTSWNAAVTKCSQTLVFDQEFLDDGGLHNTSTGIVSIKISGVYYISVSIGAYQNKPTRVSIKVNGGTENKGAVLRADDWHNGQDTLERSVVLRLAAGDQVSIFADAFAANNGYIWSDNTYKVTSFLGYLVYS